jgi:hypothetical protein
VPGRGVGVKVDGVEVIVGEEVGVAVEVCAGEAVGVEVDVNVMVEVGEGSAATICTSSI